MFFGVFEQINKEESELNWNQWLPERLTKVNLKLHVCIEQCMRFVVNESNISAQTCRKGEDE